MFKKIIKTLPGLVILSLLVHLFFWSSAFLLNDLTTVKKGFEKPVEIVILPKKNLQQQKQARQIVEVDKKQINDEVPDKKYFLSKHNQKVKKQTRSQNNGKFKNQVVSGQQAQKSSRPQKKRVAKKSPPQRSKKIANGTLPTLKELVPKFRPQADLSKFSKALPGKASQTNDHLKELDKGPQTLLSTREFVYYSYYQRIRIKIRQAWEPIIRAKVKKVFSQGRSIASARDRITKVIIVLNPVGELMKVQIVGKSGVSDLDEAATEAFRAAEPFPNPPNGIEENDGTIKIRWDFILEA